MKAMVTGALRSAAKVAFRRGGGIRVARWLNRHGLRILTYHHFAGRASLERQCAHIRQCYTPVTMEQTAQAFAGGKPLPAKALAVTVDDGYRDFFEVAYPVFQEFGIPATVFVVTRFLDGGYWLWGDRVKYAFRHTPLERTRLELPDGTVLTHELPDPPARERAATEVKERAKLLCRRDCSTFVDSVAPALGIEIPGSPDGEFQAMSWDEARQAAAGGMEIGAHTVSHPILSSLGSWAEMAEEIAGSKRRIESQLDRPAPHFCYPNGRMRDIGPATAAVRDAGFATAVTTEPGVNRAGADPFLLLRIGVESSYPPAYFEQRAAAVGI
jgi:peptidoglycan/xylan/chitin deacetylase (PgdA/CDA1 family)